MTSAGLFTGRAVAGRSDALLRVRDLTVAFPTGEGTILAPNGVSLDVHRGETVGIVGESGCGKSVSLKALLGLVPPPGRVERGEAVWKGDTDLLRMSPKGWRQVRGSEIAMVFQDPSESVDPVFSIGDQLREVLHRRGRLSRSAARREAVRLLERVHIPGAAKRLGDYSHQLSGGMRQRVLIALAIASSPALLLADEPTTALDVTIQDQILSLLAELQDELHMAIVLVSHDLDVIAQCADRVLVMYAGRVVEAGTATEVLDTPRHPYTAALLAAVSRVHGGGVEVGRSEAIAGQPPNLASLPPGCSFAPRCQFARPACAAVEMTLDGGAGDHGSACPMIDVHADAELKSAREAVRRGG
jgi:peptide/nickel transport system ATP-binding protein